MGTRADRLQELLAKHGLNPTSAAKAAGLNHRFIHDLLKKPEMSPQYDSLRRLAEVLQTTPQWIEEGIEPIADLDKPTAELVNIVRRLPRRGKLRMVENAKIEARFGDKDD